MDHVGWLSLGPSAYFHKNVSLVQGKRLGTKLGLLLLWRVPSGLASGGGFKKCLLHGYLLITSGLTIWVALLWPPCGHYFPLSYIVINDFGHTDKVLPKTANHDLIRCSRVTSTSSQTTSSNR